MVKLHDLLAVEGPRIFRGTQHNSVLLFHNSRPRKDEIDPSLEAVKSIREALSLFLVRSLANQGKTH